MNARNSLLCLPALSLCYQLTLAEPSEDSNLETELSTFSEWQVEQSRFCPEDIIVVLARIENISDTPVPLRLAGGAANRRALLTVRSDDGTVVWDTDELDRMEEQKHIDEHGMGRIMIGPTRGHHQLDPGASAFWMTEWAQRDLEGELVAPGEYLVGVQYRWRYSEEADDIVPIEFEPVRVLVSEEGCY